MRSSSRVDAGAADGRPAPSAKAVAAWAVAADFGAPASPEPSLVDPSAAPADLAQRVTAAVHARQMLLLELRSFLGTQQYIRGTQRSLPAAVVTPARVKLRRLLVAWRERTLDAAELLLQWLSLIHI